MNSPDESLKIKTKHPLRVSVINLEKRTIKMNELNLVGKVEKVYPAKESKNGWKKT